MKEPAKRPVFLCAYPRLTKMEEGSCKALISVFRVTSGVGKNLTPKIADLYTVAIRLTART